MLTNHVILLFICLPLVTLSDIIFPDGSRGGSSKSTSNGQSTCPGNTICMVPGKCRTLDLLSDGSGEIDCQIVNSKGLIGLCCPEKDNSADNSTLPISAQFEISGRHLFRGFRLPRFPLIRIELASKKSLKWLKNLQSIEKELIKRKLFTKIGSSAQFHQDLLGHSDEALQVSRDGELIHRTSIELAKELQLQGTEQIMALRSISFQNSPVSDRCPPERPCPSSKYRQPDGSCNNLNKPALGKALSPFGRLIPPDYADGIDAPRSAKSGRELPSARRLSLSVLPASSRQTSSHRYSLLLMVFGQFIDHDMIQTVATRLSASSGIQCCHQLAEQFPRLLHPACYPVTLPQDDPFYSQFRTNCMAVVRSAPAPRPGCQSGPREQLNQHSSFIDGGMIYGTSEREERSLRTGRGGLLATSHFEFGDLLPQDRNTSCQSRRAPCFSAGDGRSNEHPRLTALHTVWTREHNRIANDLSSLNPGWSDEIIFQESKRIVIAELQHIIYEEFLPILLGRRVMKAFDLFPNLNGYSRNYDPNTDPSIVSGFASAAYRLHTMVPSFFELRNDRDQVVDRKRLSDLFFDPSDLYNPVGLSLMINGLTGQPADRTDHQFTTELTNNLFKTRSSGFGMDLVSINIQRGRDHGVPGYNQWREACGLRRATRFTHLSDYIESTAIQRLSELYETVDDIDLFVGGSLESRLPGSLVGPVFSCIIAEQFRRLKEGDRFWYENGNLESSFTQNQLREIRKTSLARILCDNGDIDSIQPLALLLPSRWNHKINCQSQLIERMDLQFWRNEPVWSRK